jgi:hypothetical protein
MLCHNVLLSSIGINAVQTIFQTAAPLAGVALQPPIRNPISTI